MAEIKTGKVETDSSGLSAGDRKHLKTSLDFLVHYFMAGSSKNSAANIKTTHDLKAQCVRFSCT